MDKKRTVKVPCECLDFVEASHRHQVYPLMYCHIKILGHLNDDKLRQAVALSSKVVPEILYTYDFSQNAFVNLGHTPDDVIKYMDIEKFAASLRQDLTSSPQLQILIAQKEKHDLVVIIMSHLLADGEGFLQYLYLLASLYNGNRMDAKIKNQRDISPLLDNIHVLPLTEQTKIHKHCSVPALRSNEKGNLLFCLTSQISNDEMENIHQKATQLGVTLNDVFMTAYARVIARLQDIDAVILPCPADLRRFSSEPQYLTVANMTGIYQRITVEHPCQYEFSSTLQQIHIEMLLQKSRYRCFSGIKVLNKIFPYIPHNIVGFFIKAAYRLLPVSYTNFGIVNDEKFFFKDCSIQDCFLTGTYRIAPDFQLTVSTFRNTCTLNCTLVGTEYDKAQGQYVLDQIKCEILEWIK